MIIINIAIIIIIHINDHYHDIDHYHVQNHIQGPGIFFVIPCVDRFRCVDLRTVSFDVPPQEVRQDYWHHEDYHDNDEDVEEEGNDWTFLESRTEDQSKAGLAKAFDVM